MTKKQREANRKWLAEQFAQFLEDNYDRVRVWTEDERSGPMGGVSSQVLAAIEDEDGTVVPIAINVYSDSNIQHAVEAKVAEDERNREFKRSLGWEDDE